MGWVGGVLGRCTAVRLIVCRPMGCGFVGVIVLCGCTLLLLPSSLGTGSLPGFVVANLEQNAVKFINEILKNNILKHQGKIIWAEGTRSAEKENKLRLLINKLA